MPKRVHKQRKYSERSRKNLRPFNTLPPDEMRELARQGGIASGERRRQLADIRLNAIEAAAAYDLIHETREEYRAAIERYVREERKKARNRKKGEER